MIHPSSNLGAVPPSAPDPRPARLTSRSAGSDRIALPQRERLQEALQRTPEIRPEVVARGRALAVDPSYPPLAIIDRVAQLIAASQDPAQFED